MGTLRVMVLIFAGWLMGCAEMSPGSSVLRVYAASSLIEAFSDLERTFEEMHPGIDVKTVFSGSQVLRLQIEEGARADVFASADTAHMNALVSGGYVQNPHVFARNELVVIVPQANPAGIQAFPDLVRASRLVIGTEGVPIGRYTRRVLDHAGAVLGPEFVAAVRSAVASEEANVRLVRAKVELGEADAAIVYRTDAMASKAIRSVSIPPDFNVHADYVIGSVVRADRSLAVESWLAFLASGSARRVLSLHGFEVPD